MSTVRSAPTPGSGAMAMPRSLLVLSAVLILACLPSIAAPRTSAPASRTTPAAARSRMLAPITITVDVREAPRRILHARLAIPAEPGPLTLVYPKWIPGEHGPTGPVTDVAGLRFTSRGAVLPWKRDPIDMYAFHLDVPKGASTVEAELDYLPPPTTEGFSAGGSTSDKLAVVNWNQVILYPSGYASDDITVRAGLRVPQGWTHGSALTAARVTGDTIEFAPVTLTTLVDSPVLLGAYLKTIDLSPGTSPSHEMHIAGDTLGALAITDKQIADYKQLVAEAGALFGSHHYRTYHFLLTLSEFVAHFGLEHHESSDNRSYERALIDDDRRLQMAGLLSHEMVHSWNGKYRRPAGLATPDYATPMQGALLWVYEGLTVYLGNVLAARSGLRTPEQARENLALNAALLDHRTGRTWRPLDDTAVAAQLLFKARGDWANWRRRTDFYPEGELIWLEVDVIIRQKTQGARSLDDFCRRFHGGGDSGPMVKPYTLDDVTAALDEVAPYDWRNFFRTRLDATGPHPPMGGLQGAGWNLAYAETRGEVLKSSEEVRKQTDLSSSIGVVLGEDGTVLDIVPDLAAAKAGISPTMKLIAVNGRKWSRKVVREAIAASKSSAEPLELLLENSEFYKTFRLDYHDGERYPQLVRDPDRPDLLAEILKPLKPRVAGDAASK